MKRITTFVAALALVAVSIPAFAQSDKADDAAAKKEDNSCFQIIGDSNFSFGTVDQNETVEHMFEFKNSCDHVIHIDAVRPSCGCTAAVVTSKDIPPDSVAKVNVKFTPPRMTSGKVTKTVSVYIQGDSRPHTVIRFTAEVKSDLMLNPRSISLRGAIVGTQMSERVTIKNMTEKTVSIPKPMISMYSYADTSSAGNRPAVAIPLNNVSVSPETFTLAPGASQVVTIMLTPQYKGQLNGNLRYKTEKSETWLQVYGVVRENSGNMIHK